MSVTAEVVVPQPRLWYMYLVLDPWIAISWLLFASTGTVSALMYFAGEQSIVARQAAAATATTTVAQTATQAPPPTTTKSSRRSKKHRSRTKVQAASVVVPPSASPQAAPPRPPLVADLSTGAIVGRYMFTGYVFWSAYFGWAACWRLLLLLGQRISITWAAAAGCAYFATAGAIFLLVGGIYGFAGGGLFHFFRRWWLLSHGQRPAFVGFPPRPDSVESRLAKVDDLRRLGAISATEYSQRRDDILRGL